MSDHGILASGHSECNSRSSSGSDLSRESEGDVKREHVSSWSLEDLWTKRIFYNERESTLKELTDLVLQNSISNGNRHKFVCTPVEDTPEIMKQLVKHTQNALQFTFNESGQVGDGVLNVENYEEAIRAMAEFDAYELKLNTEIEKIGLSQQIDFSIFKNVSENFLKPSLLKRYMIHFFSSEIAVFLH